MTINIKDRDAFLQMVRVEGGQSFVDQSVHAARKGCDNCFEALHSRYVFHQEKMKNEQDPEEVQYMLKKSLGVIYGLGGMSRYSVRGNGDIIFIVSKSPERAELAKALGFDLME